MRVYYLYCYYYYYFSHFVFNWPIFPEISVGNERNKGFILSHPVSILRPFSRWTWVSQYQNVSFLDFVGDKDD